MDAIGWTPFYLVCTVASVPGLLLLQRFAPLGGREPELDALEAVEARPVSRGRVAVTSVLVALAGSPRRSGTAALLAALKAARGHAGAGVDFGAALARALSPADVSDWVSLAAFGVIGLVSGAAAAAYLVARHGLRGGNRNG